MTDTQTGGPQQDAVDILTADHQAMLELLGQIESAADPAQRRDLADTVIAEVMRHAVAEEMYVYPAMEKHVPNGAEEVEHDKKEHDELVEVMKQMEDADASGAQFMDLVREMERQLRHHVEDEEADQFPKLRTHTPPRSWSNWARRSRPPRSWRPRGPIPTPRILNCSTRRSDPASGWWTGCGTS